jgi:hypothetical protein
MTLLSSANNGCTNALARCTSSVMALIPVLIMTLQKNNAQNLNEERPARIHFSSVAMSVLRLMVVGFRTSACQNDRESLARAADVCQSDSSIGSQRAARL